MLHSRNIADPPNSIGVRCNSICHSSACHNNILICTDIEADFGVRAIRYLTKGGSGSEDEAPIEGIGYGRRVKCDSKRRVDCNGLGATGIIGVRRPSESGDVVGAWFDDSSSQRTMSDQELLDVSVRCGGRVVPCVRFAGGVSEAYEVTPHSEVYGVHPRYFYFCKGRDHAVVKVVRRGPEKANVEGAQRPSRGDRAASKGEQKRTSFIF